jgi:hypothetical protein
MALQASVRVFYIVRRSVGRKSRVEEAEMDRKHYVLTAALVLTAAIAGAASSGASLFATASVQARSEERDERGKWEYCAVTKPQYAGSSRGNQYWITYFRSGKVQVVDVEGGVTGNALSNAIFKLGEEGWEMVGEGALEVRTPNNKALYFKRRKL